MTDFRDLVDETTVRGSNGVPAVSVLVRDKSGGPYDPVSNDVSF